MSIVRHHSLFPCNKAAIGEAAGVNNAKWQVNTSKDVSANGEISNANANG